MEAFADQVLDTLADILRSYGRSDFIARYGGEKFAVTLVVVEPADLAPLAERILETVRTLNVDYRDNSIRLTCAAGVAV